MQEYNDFKIVQGQKFTTVISKKDKSGVVIPLDNMKARMNVMYGDFDGELALQLTTENDGIVIDSNDKLNIVAKTAQTSLLKFDKAVYEIELIDGEDEVTGWLYGRLTILKGKI